MPALSSAHLYGIRRPSVSYEPRAAARLVQGRLRAKGV